MNEINEEIYSMCISSIQETWVECIHDTAMFTWLREKVLPLLQL